MRLKFGGMKAIFDFLKELEVNNNREWFTEHKDTYLKLKEEFEKFVEELIEGIAQFDEEIRGVQVKDCVYRIYRDIRFSPDKTPYKNYFSAYIAAQGGRKSDRAGYYIHLQPRESFIAGGIYCPAPPLLKRIRQDLYDNIDEFLSILQDKQFAKEFPQLDETGKLKKVPAPFPSDFEYGDLLKYKHYTVGSNKPESFFKTENMLEKVLEVFKTLQPFNRFLNYSLDELSQGEISFDI